MKKNILALFLALVLATSLVTPTLALEPPLWQQFEYDSKEEFMKYFYYEPLTDADYAWLENSYPTDIAVVTASLDEYAQLFYESTAAGVMKHYEIDEAQLIVDLASQLTTSKFYLYKFRLELGMNQDGINVQVNGKYLPFSGATPSYVEGNLVAPLSALAKGLGSTASNQAGATQLRYGGQQLTIVPGQAQLKSLQADGSTRSITAPVAPYQQGSELYVPLRAFGEALGLEVYYDDGFECAVLLDKQALIDTVDSRFKKFNEIFPLLKSYDSQLDWEKGAQMTSSIAFTMTKLDSLDGNKQYPINAKMTLKGKGDLLSLAVNLKVESLVDILVEELSYGEAPTDAEFIKQTDTFKKALSNAEIKIIADTGTNTLYFQSPTLVKLLQDLYPSPISLSADSWFKSTISELQASPQIDPYYLPDIPISFVYFVEPTDTETMGQMIWNKVLNALNYDVLENGDSPYEIYRLVQFYDELFSTLVGDAKFTSQGSRHSLNFDLSKLTEDQQSKLTNLFDVSQLKGQLVLDSQAKTCTGQLTTRTAFYYDDSITQTTLNWNLSPNGLSLTGQTHERHTMQADFKIDAQWGSLQGELPSAPPAGAKIVDLDALFNQPTE